MASPSAHLYAGPGCRPRSTTERHPCPSPARGGRHGCGAAAQDPVPDSRTAGSGSPLSSRDGAPNGGAQRQATRSSHRWLCHCSWCLVSPSSLPFPMILVVVMKMKWEDGRQTVLLPHASSPLAIRDFQGGAHTTTMWCLLNVPSSDNHKEYHRALLPTWYLVRLGPSALPVAGLCVMLSGSVSEGTLEWKASSTAGVKP
eukprot:1159338-Pelagomonas_calceolata.AAC.7